MRIVEDRCLILQTRAGTARRPSGRPSSRRRAGKGRREHVASEPEESSGAQLADLIARHATRDGVQDTAVPGLHLYRSFTASEPIHTVYRPSFCLVAQGSKTVTLGTEVLGYGPADFLLVSVNMPVATRLLAASAKKPHLALHVDLDVSLIASLIAAMGPMEEESGSAEEPGAGLRVGRLEGRVREVITRLVRLLDEPRDITVLAPLITRELCYLLLDGRYGGVMRAMAQTSGPAHGIADAIARLEKAFREPLRVGELAREVHMSVSGFHRHFKAVTAMSPLQFQKRLRLQEARRMLIGSEVDVTNAGLLVGVREPLAVQPGVPPAVRPPTDPGHRPPAAEGRPAPGLAVLLEPGPMTASPGPAMSGTSREGAGSSSCAGHPRRGRTRTRCCSNRSARSTNSPAAPTAGRGCTLNSSSASGWRSTLLPSMGTIGDCLRPGASGRQGDSAGDPFAPVTAVSRPAKSSSHGPQACRCATTPG